MFRDDGIIPNNPHLPFLVYRSAIDLEGQASAERAIESTFGANGWGDMWRNGIFPYVHYHSMIHEALGGSYDLCRGSKAEHAKALKTIPEVPLPDSDPVHGKAGPLTTLWQAAPVAL
jgi:uncharacterized protein YjlB